MGVCVCTECLCISCCNPDCEYFLCNPALVLEEGCYTAICSGYETQENYYYDDDGNEYWIGTDNRRHYTRDEG